MVWEQKSEVIVMLSDSDKVDPYWPEKLNEPCSYGGPSVKMINISQHNHYTIRDFKLSLGKAHRRVTHFYFHGFSELSANLSCGDVLEFLQVVHTEITHNSSKPVIFHCSAGVGRTGTFIALDYFMQYIDRHSLDDTIDVYNYVLEMRKARPHMVQAEMQYIFIFDALQEVIKRKMKAEREHVYAICQPSEDGYNTWIADGKPYISTAVGKQANATAADIPYTNLGFEGDSSGSLGSTSAESGLNEYP